jgi:ribosomal protein S18 acetylase RimI-like enzyme
MTASLRIPVAQASAAIYHFRDDVRADDCHSVRALISKTGYFRADEIDIAVELVEERLSRGVASGYEFLFVETGTSLAGYACFGQIPCTISSYDLYWIAVDPDHQRNGIGRGLIAAVQSRVLAVGGDRIYIDTSGKDQYSPTRKFYERSGFACDARLKDFYGPGDDRVIYAKILAPGS